MFTKFLVNSGYTVNGEANSNEDDNGHGTTCAIMATGLQHGLAHRTKSMH